MSEPTTRPLVLDVDGTMIRSDLTHELLFEGFRAARPWDWPRLLKLGLTDKPELKREFVQRIGHRIDVDLHPLEPLAVNLAKEAKADGRDVYLCSGSEQSLVERLAARLPYVDGAFGTTPGYNMTAQNKADFLEERFPDGFDYVGNSSQDYEPWEAAHTAYAIRPPEDAEFKRSASGKPVVVLEHRYSALGGLSYRGAFQFAGYLLSGVIFATTLFSPYSPDWVPLPAMDERFHFDLALAAVAAATLFLAATLLLMLSRMRQDRVSGAPNALSEGRIGLTTVLRSIAALVLVGLVALWAVARAYVAAAGVLLAALLFLGFLWRAKR